MRATAALIVVLGLMPEWALACRAIGKLQGIGVIYLAKYELPGPRVDEYNSFGMSTVADRG